MAPPRKSLNCLNIASFAKATAGQGSGENPGNTDLADMGVEAAAVEALVSAASQKGRRHACHYRCIISAFPRRVFGNADHPGVDRT